jgi:carboxymethylenebutenolidase
MGEHSTLTSSDGHEFAAYTARPDGAAKGGIVVVQEIFGVNAHIREVCDGFAANGYTATAPALFDRMQRGVELDYTPEGIGAGRDIMMKMDWDKSMEDVKAVAASLKGDGKVGLVGYCWGGSVAWIAACRDSLDCSVGYYGGKIIDFLDEKPNCPTMLHFGDKDASIPIESAEKIKAAHPDVTVYRYAEAEHGFHCDHRASYHAESAKIAGGRTMAFFAENLG